MKDISKYDKEEVQELKDIAISNIKDELEEQLHGECISDYITKSEMIDELDYFDKWAETAELGDKYYYGGQEYTFNIDLEELDELEEEEIEK